MKIVTVVGARPQFIKAAAVSHILRKKHTEVLVHTGQHYDENLSAVFFDELEIPPPDYNLGVGSGSQAWQIAEIMKATEKVLEEEKPDCTLVYGDTNSTLAAALVSARLGVPVAHVEAGIRGRNTHSPEEQNRILADHLAKWLFCNTDEAAINLKNEGIVCGVYAVGDVMYDALAFFSCKVDGISSHQLRERVTPLFEEWPFPKEWYLATIHRAENTGGDAALEQVLQALNQLDRPVIFPVHPRTRPLIKQLERWSNIRFARPTGYLEMIYLLKNAAGVVTDSGGLMRESYMLKVPCTTVLENIANLETLTGNWNISAKPCADDIVAKVYRTNIDRDNHPDFYGDGRAAARITEILEQEAAGGYSRPQG